MDPAGNTARLIRVVAAGMLVGMLVLLLFRFPAIINTLRMYSHEAILQKNLLSARGEAFEDIELAEVSLRAVLNGAPQAGVSASLDHQNWFIPQGGLVSIKQVPGYYERIAATYGNRIVWQAREIITDNANEITLDVGNAPLAPELAIYEITKGEKKTIPLEINQAEAIDIVNAPNGVAIVHDASGFSLLIDGKLPPDGFSHIVLKAVNQYGYALMHVGLRISREDEIIPIYTVEDLFNIRYKKANSYRLMNDLDMSDMNEWMEIGTQEYNFTGVFDGGGHEIRGFHNLSNFQGESFSLFGHIRNAEVKNLIIRDPLIVPWSSDEAQVGVALCHGAISSLIMNCASMGGSISSYFLSGLIAAARDTVIKDCFNSTDVFSTAPSMPSVGGVLGGLYENSYIANCANEGEIHGSHLSGGVVAYNQKSTLFRCLNSGYIWGHTLVGEIMPSGIMHTTDQGFAAYGYFTRGSAPIGGNVFEPYGAVNSLLPIAPEDLRKPEKMPLIGTFEGDNPDWVYASLDANGPVPNGIFKTQAKAPMFSRSGNQLILPPREGTKYYYTLDGTNPYSNCREGIESLEINLANGQILTVFAAEQGCRDSEVVIYRRK